MEKLGFGALLKTAFKRCFERQLSHIVAAQVMIAFLALLPMLIGAVALVVMYALKTNPWAMLAVVGAIALYYLPCLYFLCLMNYGMMREVIYPEAQIGRGLRNGFARWKIAFYPIPWMIASGIASGVMQRAAAGNVGGAALHWVISILLGIVSTFVGCAVAASDTTVSFADFCKRVFTAVKNGWWRALCGMFVLGVLFLAVFLLAAIPVAVRFFILRGNGPLPAAGWIALYAVIVGLFIYLGFRLWVFSCVYMMNLFVDASGITRAEMGLPVEGGEAETPVTVEVHAAPETPAEEGTDREK